jgi:hypothetical protein
LRGILRCTIRRLGRRTSLESRWWALRPITRSLHKTGLPWPWSTVGRLRCGIGKHLLIIP